MTQETLRSNSFYAKQIREHGKTIAVLTDKRPGFDPEAAGKIILFLVEHGFYVHEITADELCAKDLARLGFLLVIPHAASVPAKCAEPIRRYVNCGGQIITLGGPLFADLVEKEGDEYKVIPLDDQTLDATFSGRMPQIIIEGLCPSHKIFYNENVRQVKIEEDQCLAKANLRLNGNEQVISPCARPHGAGYNMDRRDRFIPLVQVMGEGGRAEGRRGAAAFFMLSNTRGKPAFVNGNHPGTVSNTTIGSAAASIGFTRQDILNIDGAGDLLLSIVKNMERGLYLFEGGSDKFLYDEKSGDMLIGAKVLSLSHDYRMVKVCFTLKGPKGWSEEKEIFTAPRNMSQIEIRRSLPRNGSYTIETELLFNGEVIDRISHEMNVTSEKTRAAPDDFVSVQDGEFFLKGNPWPAFGINYWPHYCPSMESEDYWLGWLDKSNYDPLEVERDLIYMKEMGYTCVYTRLDSKNFERFVPQLRDFMYRLDRHGLKLSLSLCNITCPVIYQPEAYRLLVKEAGILDNPILFSHDIAWEVGSAFFMDFFIPQWNKKWEEWLVDRYGSVENAEKDFGMGVPRAEDGSIAAPPMNEFKADGPWRVRSAAYRRFMDNMVSRMWNDVVSDMRKADPAHLIAYRMGSISYDTAAIMGTSKHIDYASPEGYYVPHSEEGYFSSCCVTKLFDMSTEGKPVIWSEFGTSIAGAIFWNSLIWDNKNHRPYPEMLEKQTAYMNQFFRMFKATGVRGSAPWWYPGGFRRTEMSDFGFIGPDGLPRPAAVEYSDMRQWFDKPRERKPPDYVVTVDPDEHAGGFASIFFGENMRGPGLLACKEAEENGKTIAFRTPGTGTTSADTPLLAVGNVPYNGHNPPKYLDAEFNHVELIIGKNVIPVPQGSRITAPAGEKVYINASIGNIREATWLSPANAKTGGVYLVSGEESPLAVKIPIGNDVPYLADAVIKNAFFCEAPKAETTVELRMTADGRMRFGEIWRFTLSPK